MGDPRTVYTQKRLQCYDLVLDSLIVFENKCNVSQAPQRQEPFYQDGDLEAVRSHAYELAFACEDEIFHSTLYDRLISRGLADDLLEVWKFLLRMFRFDHIHLDASDIPRSPFKAGACHCAEIPTLVAILCQEWPVFTRG